MIKLFKKDFDTSKLKMTRTDSVNFATARKSGVSEITQTVAFDYEHLLDIEITKFLTINSSVGMNYALTWNKIAKLGASAMLGATLKF